MRMILLVILLVPAIARGAGTRPECFSELDVKHNVCRALCAADELKIGYYHPKSGKCVCGQLKAFKELKAPIKLRTLLPSEQPNFVYLEFTDQ